MTSNNKTDLPKNLAKYVPAWDLLNRWDAAIAGKLPTAANIDDAIAVMSKPGGKPAVLNQGIRALVMGFRTEGSTDGQRAYASMVGAPHNNVGKLGDALRSQTPGKSSRLDVGKPVNVTLPGGIVTVTSNKSGHVHFNVAERFAAPVTPTPTTATDKPAKGKRKGKARKPKVTATEPVQAPATDDTATLTDAELDAMTAPACEPVTEANEQDARMDAGSATYTEQGGDTLPSGDGDMADFDDRANQLHGE